MTKKIIAPYLALLIAISTPAFSDTGSTTGGGSAGGTGQQDISGDPDGNGPGGVKPEIIKHNIDINTLKREHDSKQFIKSYSANTELFGKGKTVKTQIGKVYINNKLTSTVDFWGDDLILFTLDKPVDYVGTIDLGKKEAHNIISNAVSAKSVTKTCK